MLATRAPCFVKFRWFLTLHGHLNFSNSKQQFIIRCICRDSHKYELCITICCNFTDSERQWWMWFPPRLEILSESEFAFVQFYMTSLSQVTLCDDEPHYKFNQGFVAWRKVWSCITNYKERVIRKHVTELPIIELVTMDDAYIRVERLGQQGFFFIRDVLSWIRGWCPGYFTFPWLLISPCMKKSKIN